MHPSSIENMTACIERFLAAGDLDASTVTTVLDVGGADVNGNYRQLFPSERFRYLVADVSDLESVDVRMTDPQRIPLDDGSVDVVISGQTLEHCDFFWILFAEMVRVMAPEGFLFLIVPSAGPIHRFPVDCYRFYPDSLAALARFSGSSLVDWWHDERGPWRDLVGVFRHAGATPVQPAERPANPSTAGTPPSAPLFQPDSPQERVSPAEHYLDTLAKLHAALAPRRYLEIGVRAGASLALASCPAIAIDPSPSPRLELAPTVRLFESTSDRFFATEAARVLEMPPDLVFIDGMHLFEYALRDFMNVERCSSATTVVVIDDIFPNHPVQAARDRTTKVWTGDVWKLHDCLAARRKDLILLPLDCGPTGMLLVLGLDPANRVLWNQYNPIVREYTALQDPPTATLERHGSVGSDHPAVAAALGAVVECRAGSAPPGRTAATIRQAIRRAQRGRMVAGRSFAPDMDGAVFDSIQAGVMNSSYRGVPFLKSPFDIGLYLQLIGRLRPRTVIEIGSKAGGSALWFADQLTAHGLDDPRVVSVDLDPPSMSDPRIEFLAGDAGDLGSSPLPDRLRSLSHPWLVVEDSSHLVDDVRAVLDFFDSHLRPGDYIVVEDGVVSSFRDPRYERFADGPNRAVAAFLADRTDAYEIDAGLCDFYGYNATHCPNAWLRRR